MAETVEEKPPKPRIGKKGVLAKRVAMDRKAKEIEKGAKDVQAGIKSQAKENEDAVARMRIGVKELQNAAKEYIKDFYYG